MDDAGAKAMVTAAPTDRSPEPAPTDEPIDPVTVARKGEEAIFIGLYPRLRRFAAVTAPLGTEPDDVVQEAMVRVLGRGRLTDLDEPLAYIRRTILNIVRNDHRRLTREANAYRRAQAADERSRWDEGVDRNDVDLAILDALTPETRALIYLVDVEGLATADAAALTGLSPVAARARLSRGRRAVRQRLSDHPEDGAT